MATALAASAQTSNPVRQALVSSTGTFWDTVIICALTGLVIVSSLQAVWNLADCMNALMAIPNLLSLIFLSGIIVRETRKYLWSGRLDEGMEE